jgi:hypothetical protein
MTEREKAKMMVTEALEVFKTIEIPIELRAFGPSLIQVLMGMCMQAVIHTNALRHIQIVVHSKDDGLE